MNATMFASASRLVAIKRVVCVPTPHTRIGPLRIGERRDPRAQLLILGLALRDVTLQAYSCVTIERRGPRRGRASPFRNTADMLDITVFQLCSRWFCSRNTRVNPRAAIRFWSDTGAEEVDVLGAEILERGIVPVGERRGVWHFHVQQSSGVQYRT